VSGTVEETLAWEAEQRPRAGLAALLGGLLTILGTILLLLTTGSGPTEDDGFVSVTESISARLNGNVPEEPSLLIRGADSLADKLPQLYASTILTSLAAVGALLALAYLYRATKARSPETTGKAPIIAVAIAGPAFVIGHAVREIATWSGIAGLGDDARPGEFRDVFNGSTKVVGELIEQIGTFALGLAFVLVALNAMRVGLLTRFLGVLGIIVGGLTIVPIDQPQIVRTIWLLVLGSMLLGWTRRPLPPAWETGRAIPWPSNQQIREARQQAALGTNVPPSEPDSPVEKGATAASPATAAKRKRKKRK
jgi:hypothetical protein